MYLCRKKVFAYLTRQKFLSFELRVGTMFGVKIVANKHVRFLSKKSANKEINISFNDGIFKLHRLEKGPPMKYTTSRDELLEHYREMYLFRRTELIADQLYKAREIKGFLHMYTGQESICSGFESVLSPEDSVITAYRCHCFLLTKRCGLGPKDVLSELTGRKTGCASGKGGSMHLYNIERNFFGGNGIVGSNVSLGTGLAFANKYKNNGRVTFTYMGDGALNQGQVHESFNMAALWKLPIVYVVENNLYGMGTSVERASANTKLYTRGDVIPGLLVAAYDVLAVKAAGRFAIEYAMKNGPLIIEASAYRYVGHSVSDPGTSYRQRSEIQEYREKFDCINIVKRRLIENDLCTEEELENINKEISRQVDEAKEFALASPHPTEEDLYMDVYSKKMDIRGVELIHSYKAPNPS